MAASLGHPTARTIHLYKFCDSVVAVLWTSRMVPGWWPPPSSRSRISRLPGIPLTPLLHLLRCAGRFFVVKLQVVDQPGLLEHHPQHLIEALIVQDSRSQDGVQRSHAVVCHLGAHVR